MWKRSGLGRLELEAASAGDIVSITGAGTARIADTVGSPDLERALSPGVIEPPTLRCTPCLPPNCLCLFCCRDSLKEKSTRHSSDDSTAYLSIGALPMSLQELPRA